MFLKEHQKTQNMLDFEDWAKQPLVVSFNFNHSVICVVTSSFSFQLCQSIVNFYIIGIPNICIYQMVYITGIPKSRNLNPAGANYPYQWVSSAGIMLFSACSKEDTVQYLIKHIKVRTHCLKYIVEMSLGLVVLSHYLVSLHWISHLQRVDFRQLRNFLL